MDPSSRYAMLQGGDVTAYKVRKKVTMHQKSCQTWISRKFLKGYFIVLHFVLA